MKAEPTGAPAVAKPHFSPQEVSREQLLLAYIIDKIASLPPEAVADLATLGPELANCKCQEDFMEITDAIKEIIFPELLGDLHASETMKETDSEKLQKWKDHFAKKLLELRKQAGLTQEQLAKKTGLPQSHISRLEKAIHSPARKTVERIADALGIETRELDTLED